MNNLENVAQASRLSEISHSRDDCATLQYAIFKPLDFGIPINISRRNLPHWEQEGTTYFITFRLSDSLPAEKLDEWKTVRAAWLKNHSLPYSKEEWQEYNKLFSQRINDWLDLGHGSCLLRKERVSQIVSDALRYFDGKKYSLGEWVIMPNHVHFIITPYPTFELSDILRSIKSYTSHQINKLLGHSGKIWQEESFDHIIRNERQKNRIEQYIIDNPKTAGLTTGFKCSSENVAQASSPE
jgi:REP element-mobilizing transposase RayT